MNIGELFVKLGFKSDNSKVKEFSNSVNQARIGLVGIYTAALGAGVAVMKFTADAITSAWQLSNFSNQTGLSYEQLQKWQIMANQAGVSGQNMAQSIQNLQRNLAEIKLGRGDVQPFQMLGIDVMQDAWGVMNQVRGAIKDMDRMTAVNFITRMGFTPDMINVLTLTNKQLKEMHMNDTILSSSQVESLKSAGVAFTNLMRILKFINSLVAVQLSPIIVKLVNKFNEWAMVNKDKLIRGLEMIGKLMLRFIEAIFNSFTMIDKIVSHTIGWQNALKGIVAVLAAVSVALMATPIGAFIASIIALILILDDLYTWKTNKGKSVFGELLGPADEFSEKMSKSPAGKLWSGFRKRNPRQYAVGGFSNMVQEMAGGESKKVEINNTVYVKGVDKPQETADAVEKVFTNKINNASLQLNNAGI